MKPKQYQHLLTRYLRPQWPRALLLAALLLGGIGLQLAGPQILRRFIDVAKSNGPQETLVDAALLFIGVVFAGQVLHGLVTYVGEDVGWTATNLLRADLVLHCLQLDMSFHHEHTPGEMIERVDGDVAALSNFFSRFVVSVLGSALLAAGILLLLLREDWRVGLASAAYAVAVLVALSRFQHTMVPCAREARQAVAELSGFWEERLSGTEDIRSNGARPYVKRQHYQLLRALLHKGCKSLVMWTGMWAIGEVLLALGSATVLALGAYALNAGTMTLGTIYLIYHYTGLYSWNLTKLMEQMGDLQAATASIERIDDLLHTRSQVRDGPVVGLSPGPLAVEFQDVSFGYTDDGGVLQCVSFRLGQGQVLGLLGRTGSGKTTLARLLFRFYDPDRGAVCVDEVDVRQLRLADLRHRVGLVTQEVQLFHATVRDNLTFFDSSIPDSRILQVIEELGLSNWYGRLAEGLDTELLSGGRDLSAGEAQLVALTRVFLKDPGLVILDEASSRLDPVTERAIERAVDRLLRNRTGIIIAHHLATVQRADEIMILEDGRVYEHGARERLAVTPTSRFYRLVQTGEEALLA